jgi:zinc transport system substrate-binding protein
MRSKIFLFLLALISCGPSKETSEPKKPLVLVSIAPYQFLAERICGDALEIQAVVPAGSNPHVFEPTAAQVASISKGEVWFRIGEPFEGKILPFLLHQKPGLVVVDLRDSVELQPADDGHTCCHSSSDHMDRHVWLSPKLAAKQAVAIAESLSKRFPEKKELFMANLETCLAEIEKLDLEIQTLLSPQRARSLIVSHSAFQYFCLDYGLTQLSVEQEGKDPRPRHLEEMLAKAKRARIAVALTLPQYNNKGAQLIAKEMNIPIRMIDPYSADYYNTMKSLAHMIASPEEEP